MSVVLSEIDRIKIVKVLLFILAVLLVISRLQRNGFILLPIVSNTYQVLIPFSLVFYFVLLSSLRMMGVKLDRFDAVFLPILLTLVVVLVIGFYRPEDLFNDQSLPLNTSRPDEKNLEKVSTVTKVSGAIGGNLTTVTQTITVTEAAPSWLIGFSKIINFVVGLFILIFVLLLLFYAFLATKEQAVELIEEDLYNTPVNKFQQDIIDIYRKTCYRIEGNLGKVPIWYTPSRFLWDFVKELGSPASDYFKILTDLYELARFSSHELNDRHVDEALEASNQVIFYLNSQVEDQIEEHEVET